MSYLCISTCSDCLSFHHSHVKVCVFSLEEKNAFVPFQKGKKRKKKDRLESPIPINLHQLMIKPKAENYESNVHYALGLHHVRCSWSGCTAIDSAVGWGL